MTAENLEPAANRGGDPDWLPAEIHQAAGMLSGQLDVEIAEAYSRLNAHAAATGQTPLAVARDVIAYRVTVPR